MKALFISLCLLAGAPAGTMMAANATVTISDQKPKKSEATVTFKTTMHCKNCVKKISENVSFEKGVIDLKATLDSKEVTIKYNPAKTDEETLAKAIRKLGYEVEKVIK